MSDDDFDTSWIDDTCEAHTVPRLDPEAVTALLDLAARAAHETGDRRNAPLACFVVGWSLGAAGTSPGADVIKSA